MIRSQNLLKQVNNRVYAEKVNDLMHTNAVLKSDANYLTREHQSVCWKGEWFDTYRYCSKSESCISNSLRQWGNSFPAMWVRQKTKQKLFGQASIGTHAYMKHQTNLDAHHLAVSMYMYEYISKVMKTEHRHQGVRTIQLSNKKYLLHQ
jgi:hypothetical protein